MRKLKLRNGDRIYYIDKLTALDVYNEIYNEREYMKHGIKIKTGDIIFDVGANIGLFSRFVAQQARDLKILTFEPVPVIFNVLEANLKGINASIKNYNIGLGKRSEIIDMYYYPRVSADSAIIPFDYDLKVKQYVDNFKETFSKDAPILRVVPRVLRKPFVKFLLKYLYKSEIVKCKIRTLSEIIQENDIERIDYLKIDAENYDWQVLAGIIDNDWEKIKQVVMEVHEHVKGGDNLLNKINDLLKNKGFNVVLEKNGRFAQMGVFMLYAMRR